MTPRQKANFILEKIAIFPYALVKNNPNKKLRQLMFIISCFTLVIIMTLLLPYFLYLITLDILADI